VNGFSFTSQAPEMPWFVVKVRTRAETRIAELIRDIGYHVYLPLLTETRQYSDRVRKAVVALFPGYVFCSLDVSKRLPVLMVPGVEYFVSFNGEPATVPHTELSAIESALASGLAVHPCEYLTEGDTIRVMVGSMRGVEGVLVRTKTGGRLIVSVHLLQRSVCVEVPRDWISPVGRHSPNPV